LVQAVRKKKKHSAKPMSLHVSRGVREAALFVLMAAALYLLIALFTYSRSDPGWSHTGMGGDDVKNLGGVIGAFFADVFLYLFGYLSYLAPVIVGYSGWLVYKGEKETGELDLRTLGLRWLGFVITLIAGCGLASLHFIGGSLPLNAGGLLGQSVSQTFVSGFSPVGSTLLMLAVFLAGITLFSGLSWFKLMDAVGLFVLGLFDGGRKAFHNWRDSRKGKVAREQRETIVMQEKAKAAKRRKPRIEPKLDKPEKSERTIRERQIQLFKPPEGETDLPPISLLDEPPEHTEGYSKKALEALSRQVELKLRDFNVEGEVVEVHPGPVVTRFELMLEPGTKVSKISGLAKDLARALAVMSVRIVEVIPGKPTIGLEIPNESRELVALSEIVASKIFDKSHSPLTLALGKDIGGSAVVADIARMPHLLVAGTTGSGKSVAVNAMLLSILYKAHAHEVRLILIDPKMLELSVYEGIPHLLTPVVTDMKDAANALRWCVAEMERRYKLMSALGVRNVGGYNKKVSAAIDKGKPILDPLWKPNELIEDDAAEELEPLPFIVVVVDEFADMMMTVGKKVEELIARLAQKARAAGIHLILATQRPSVDVITGLIKANIPTRMAFQVSSKVDSRTILDQAGAEQLLGHGDMLYLPPGTSMTERVHGAFVDDHEVHGVVEYLKQQGKPNYIEEITREPEPGEAAIPGLEAVSSPADDADPLYDQAVAVVTESRKASISYVQRRLKVGYNRAARMIEEMEASGVVSGVQSNGTREVIAPAPPER